MIWGVVFAAGVFILAVSVSYLLFSRLGSRDWMAGIKKLRNVRRHRPIGLVAEVDPSSGERDGQGRHISKYRQQNCVPIISILLAVIGVYMGMAYFHSLVAAVLLALIGILLPEQISYTRNKTMQEKLLEQLGTAVRMFAAEFSETPNTVKVIKVIAPNLPSPIGEIFRQVDQEFTSGKDVNRVLINLSHKLSSEYGRLFVQLLRISFEDSSVKPMFLRLATRLQGQQKLIQEKQDRDDR